MNHNKQNQSADLKEDGLIVGSSHEELPLIQQGSNLLVDARLLHKQLKSGYQFQDWIKRRIEEYGFEPGKDFFSELVSEKSEIKKGRGGDRRSIEVHLTIDMVKELCMLEKNEEGRFWRRYFIEAEKKLRGIVSHAAAPAALEENAGKPANGVLFVVPLGKQSTHSVYYQDVCYTKFAPLMKYMGYESESGSSWNVKLKEGILKMDNTWFINARGFELMLQKITRMPDIDKVRNIQRDCFGRKPNGEARYWFSMEEMMDIIKELNHSPIRRSVLTNRLIKN